MALFASVCASCLPFLVTAAVQSAPKALLAGAFPASPQASADTGWTAYGSGWTVDPSVHHGQDNAIICTAADGAQTYGAMRTVTLNQSEPEPIAIGGWSRAENVDGAANNDYSVYVDIIYADGAPLYGQTANFDTGTHGWQHCQIILRPEKPIRSFNVYALFRNHPGKVWFSGITAEQTDSSQQFDGQNITAPALAPNQTAGWFVRDVAANSPILPMASSASKLQLSFEPTKAADSAATLTASLTNRSHANRALTIYYVERFDAPNAIWWNDVRTKYAAKPAHGDYANVTTINVGANGELSLYPYGCVTGTGHGRALGIPPWLGARVVRIGYSPTHHLLYLATDLALTPAGDPNHHDRAPIAVTRFDVDPRWGFRDAVARYAAMFPETYTRRAKAEGIWMPFTAPNTVSDVGDFRFGYHEGDNSVASDRTLGVLSFRYVEPMTYWMAMPPKMPRNYEAAIAMMQDQARGGATPANIATQAQAVLYSGTRDKRGRYNVDFMNTPWCDGAVWVLNPNPGLPHPANASTKATLNIAGEPSGSGADQPDGEYLDSLEAHADVLDYSPSSFHASRLALTFATSDPSRPVLPTWFSVYEAAKSLASDLHDKGKLLMANSVPWQYSSLTSTLDVLGTETNMYAGDGAWAPDSDGIMNLRRTMSYRRPYLLLMNTDFSKTTAATIALYFQRCLFYGIYPSMFSADAASNPYWENPPLYNRDRPTFKTYIPLIQTISRAGWQPVTLATTTNSAVWVERYGSRYFTVLNPTATPQTTSITFQSNQLPAAKSAKLTDLQTGQPIDSAAITLQPSECRVLELAH